MSLAEKWKEYLFNAKNEQLYLHAAFYAGAEAYGREYWETDATRRDLEAEIDHFRSHK